MSYYYATNYYATHLGFFNEPLYIPMHEYTTLGDSLVVDLVSKFSLMAIQDHDNWDNLIVLDGTFQCYS